MIGAVVGLSGSGAPTGLGIVILNTMQNFQIRADVGHRSGRCRHLASLSTASLDSPNALSSGGSHDSSAPDRRMAPQILGCPHPARPVAALGLHHRPQLHRRRLAHLRRPRHPAARARLPRPRALDHRVRSRRACPRDDRRSRPGHRLLEFAPALRTAATCSPPAHRDSRRVPHPAARAPLRLPGTHGTHHRHHHDFLPQLCIRRLLASPACPRVLPNCSRRSTPRVPNIFYCSHLPAAVPNLAVALPRWHRLTPSSSPSLPSS